MPDTDTPELPEPHELHTPEALAAYTAQHQRWLHDVEHRAADDEARPMTAAERSYHTLVLAQLETARIAVQNDPTNGRGELFGAVRDFERRAMYGRTAGRTRRGSQLASLGARVMHALHNPAGDHGLAIGRAHPSRASAVGRADAAARRRPRQRSHRRGERDPADEHRRGARPGAGWQRARHARRRPDPHSHGRPNPGRLVSTFPRAKHRAEDTSLAAIDAEGTVTQRKELTPADSWSRWLAPSRPK